ncbi:MAG: ABC transporter substrate-binding protein, partial [Candidatus Binataceae bacterium]
VHKLSMPFAAAIPREAAEKWGEDFSQHAVGSGPFKLRQWIGGQRIALVRNPNYHIKGVPRLDAVDMLLGVNGELEWLKFEAGEIDVATIPPAEFPYVMKTSALRALTLHKTDIRVQYLGMNCEMWPFTDVRVRRAFNYAINREKLVKLLNGRGVAARGILPPNLPGSDPAVKGYAYEPGKARRLLEDPAVPRGYAPELWVRADQTALTLAQSIQQDLALVGINIALKPLAWGPLLDAIRQPRTVQLFQMGWEADFPDPDNFLNVLLTRRQWGANNDTFYYDPRVDELVDEAAPIADLTRRYELYREAERIVIDDAPWVPLYNPVSYVIRQPWVRDYQLNPLRPTRLEQVWLAERTGQVQAR